MTEPTIVYPNCKTEIKLTESLAAPLIESTRRHYEQQIAQKDADIRKREAVVKDQQAALAKAQESLDEQVTAKLITERAPIAAEEARKAKLALSTDLDQKARELAASLDRIQKTAADIIAALHAPEAQEHAA